MNVTVQFEAQVRRAAGVTSAELAVDDRATVGDLLRQLAHGTAEPVRRILLNDAGEIRPTVLVFLNGEHLPLSSDRRLTSADLITITSPISGG